MYKRSKLMAFFAIILCLFSTTHTTHAVEELPTLPKIPDYAYEFLGEDKYEKFNRKMFAFNTKLNKYALRPIHIIWASIMPKYGIERIENIHTNLVYPRRLVSTLIQRDFKGSGIETARFLTNTTLGLGGMFDPAQSIFNLPPHDENMEQALAKCNIKQGSYLVAPVIVSTTPRGIAGKLLDWALDPSSYIANPILGAVKFGLFINETSTLQPLSIIAEKNYADPYDIAKKLYGLETYIKTENLDRKNTLTTTVQLIGENELTANLENYIFSDTQVYNPTETQVMNLTTTEQPDSAEKLAILLMDENEEQKETLPSSPELTEKDLKADIELKDYNPQTPVVDSMRTALFDSPEIYKSAWSEISIWNRSFSRRIKTSSINIIPEKQNYKFRYIMQKEKNSPVAIIYPSIGEGIMSHHSEVLAKLFYDEGYSVIIQSSHFQWEYVKSMPDEYFPGEPDTDADYLKLVTNKIITSLEKKYECKFKEKTLIGTSFGALTTLFIGAKEQKNNTLNIDKFISINPPIELTYAMSQIDKNTIEWHKNPNNIKERVAKTATKILQFYNLKDAEKAKIETLPFSDEEGKLITGYIMHQKLSDLIFSLENTPQNTKTDIYKEIHNMNYYDYTKKYLLSKGEKDFEQLTYDTSLHSISDFLKTSNNYKIYHTLDDYLVNKEQLTKLKNYCGEKAIYLSHGSHLGFLYRKEFINSLKEDISTSTFPILTKEKTEPLDTQPLFAVKSN